MRSKFRTVIGFSARCCVGAVFGISLAACNNSLSGFSGFVGNTPNTSIQTQFKVLGTLGTPFTLNISDANQSWTVPGTIPLTIGIANNQTPTRMVATKLANDNSLMSVEIDNAGFVAGVSSTTAPFGVASVETGGTLKMIAPKAVPDVRVYVTGPAGERFQALVEDKNNGFIFTTRAPAVFLFEFPSGKVDAELSQIQNFGPFNANIATGAGNGTNVIVTASGGPFITIRQP
jgi:hypothetical protein